MPRAAGLDIGLQTSFVPTVAAGPRSAVGEEIIVRGFAIGLILGGVLLVTIVAVPRFVRSGSAGAAVGALDQAELARRQLHQHDPMMAVLAATADAAALGDADFDVLLANQQESLDALGSDFSEQVSAARKLDRRSNVATSDLSAVSTTPGGLRSAVPGFTQLVDENQQLLVAAAKNAGDAVAASGGTFGVSMVSGMAALADARQKLGEAQRIRSQLQRLQTEALTTAQRWARRKAMADHYGSIDVADATSGLQADREELARLLADAREEQTRLSETIAQRQAELDGVRASLRAAQTQRITLEEMGFRPGDDRSFGQYKQQYESVSEQLRMLQERESLLSAGGFETVVLDEADPLAGEMEIDGPVIGMAELERRLTIVDDQIERYDSGLAAIDLQLETVGGLDRLAKQQAERFEASVAAIQADFDSVRGKMDALAEQAIAKEAEAETAANRAVTAFAGSITNAAGQRSAAQRSQRETDPQRLNERLKKITSDDMPETLAKSAEAEANTLLGRLFAQQIQGLESYAGTWAGIIAAMPAATVDSEAIQTTIDTARTSAGTALTAAADTYTDIAQAGGVAWMTISANASLAAVEHLRSMVYSDQSGEYRAAAATAISAAADAAGQDSRGTTFALLRDRLNE